MQSTSDYSAQAYHAASRFGLGLSLKEKEAIGSAPLDWVMKQTSGNANSNKLTSLAKEGKAMFASTFPPPETPEAKKEYRKLAQKHYVTYVNARFEHQTHSTTPFIERLVNFWSNHFALSIDKTPMITPLAIAFEVEAIRPHILGNFTDMLLASSRHPAMLLYLDNARSTGPDSMAGTRRNIGLNENLAREILELHTLGVNGGYSQDDVIALARIITGWSLAHEQKNVIPEFAFNKRTHEPGPKTLLGRTFNTQGEQDGIDALTFIANHPATARFIATKLATHFISDNPSPESIHFLTQAFTASKGNLLTVSKALITLEECWNTPLNKIKTPYDFLLSTAKVINLPQTPLFLPETLKLLVQQLYRPGSPAGFSDMADDWIGPDAIIKRIQIATKITASLPEQIDPIVLSKALFGSLMSTKSYFAISNAPSREEAVAALLVSPEFQKR